MEAFDLSSPANRMIMYSLAVTPYMCSMGELVDFMFKFAAWVQDKLAEKGITNILCVSATPGLAATNLQHTTANNGGGMGLQTLMKLAQSGEDGSLPLLHCTVGADVESGDLWVRLFPSRYVHMHHTTSNCRTTNKKIKKQKQ